MNGGKLTVKILEELGVEYIFGYIGASVAPIFDALIGSKIKLIIAVDEVGAAHMADGYARVTGKPGVVLATSGPGATNLITGIATAYMDSVPMLAITANVPASKLGKDSFQEVDITGIATPITKYARIVKHISNLEVELYKAYFSAGSGRCAPVLIDITGNVFEEDNDFASFEMNPKEFPLPLAKDIENAVKLIDSAEKPLILIGGGAANCIPEIEALANKLKTPIVSTMRLAGASNSPLYFGTVGAAAPSANNKLYRSADLIIAFGTRFSDKNHNFESKKQRHIHVDIDAAELNKTIVTDVAINAKALDAINLLMPLVSERKQLPFAVSNRPKMIAGRLGKLTTSIASMVDGSFNLATDVGTHQVAMLNSLGYITQNELITSAGLGTMGFGVGGAIGSHFGNKKPVLLVTGDGGFNMSAREIATAVKYNVPLTVVIVNNKSLKMIKKLQSKQFGGRHIAIDTPEISYKLLAKSLGAEGKTLKVGNIEEELKSSLNRGGVTVYEFKTR